MFDSNWSLVLVAIASAFACFYWYVRHLQSYWSRQNLPGPKSFLIFGNIERIIRSPQIYELEWRKKFGKVFGYFIGATPILSISDPELIKQVMIKDFSHFVNRRPLKVHHEIMTEHLFLLEGERWKRVRSIVSPTFTAGKLRGMQQMMNRCVDKLDSYFDQLTTNGVSSMQTKEVLSGLTIDVIASTTFATETNANDDRRQKNPFVTQANKFFETNPFRLAAILLFPKSVNDFIGIRHLPATEPAQFFMNLTKNIVQQRKEESGSGKTKRNDLVDLLLEASVSEQELSKNDYGRLTASMDEDKSLSDSVPSSTNTVGQKLTDNEVIAQCIVFFAAGFETTAATISHILFELSHNPQCQQKLYEELSQSLSTIDRNSEQFYELVMSQMPYMDAVIKETLRKYPPLARLERRVGQDGYRLGNVVLRKGQVVEIATYIVHHDPEYFPDPERFDPERFMPQNKHRLVPYSYMPFGIGPRNCVGMRFAYQEIKLFLANIIPKYRFEITENTPKKLQFKKASFLFSSFPFELNVSKR